MESLERLLGDTRAVMAAIPAIIGLLPMPGGAMLSAPMVGAMSDRVKTPPEQRTFINYWFRHLWEYVWPLYPGVILTAALLEIPVRNVVAVNLPLTGAAILGGLLFCFRGVVRPEAAHVGLALGKHVMQLIASLWPIVVVVGAVLFKVPLLLSLSVVCAVLLIAHRPERGELREIARRSATVETVLLIVGVKVFQAVIDSSGAASQVVESFVSVNVPAALVVFAVPFIIGVLTGLTLAFVGVTFPVLMPFFIPEQGVVAYGYMMLAYAGGYLGVLFSPVHLCLVLTRDYFKADLGQVYMLLLRPALVILAIAVAWFLFGVEPFAKGLGF
jgi:integral membrane protein (TIGR00529 family)